MQTATKIKIIMTWHIAFLLLGLTIPVIKYFTTGYFSNGLFLMGILWLIGCLPWALIETKMKYLCESLIFIAVFATIFLSWLGIFFAVIFGAVS